MLGAVKNSLIYMFMEAIFSSISNRLNQLIGLQHNVWSSEGYTPPNLLIQCREWLLDIQAILSLPPSTNHNAYLSVCPYTSEDFMSSSPRLQFQFTPNPSISALRSLPMVLTSGSSQEEYIVHISEYFSKVPLNSLSYLTLATT